MDDGTDGQTSTKSIIPQEMHYALKRNKQKKKELGIDISGLKR